MDDIIKSALELALEKTEATEQPTDEERLKWKYVPEAERLAARYLKEDFNLVEELRKYDDKARRYVARGISDVLIRNINLPRNDQAKRINKRAMDSLKLVKADKVAAENIFSRIRQLLAHYGQQGEQQRQQAYESVKMDFTAKFQQAIQKQTGMPAGQVRVDVERQPQFQEEWRRVLAQLDGQYLKVLDDYKRELADIE